jgi:hypothetical protein
MNVYSEFFVYEVQDNTPVNTWIVKHRQLEDWLEGTLDATTD